jgi:hypothetical protein
VTAIVASWLSECVGCTEAVDPFGPGELVLGFVVVAIAIVPGAAVHRFLRRRGR